MRRRVASWDLETHCIQAGLLTPPIVCGAFAEVYLPVDKPIVNPADWTDAFDWSTLDKYLSKKTVVVNGAVTPGDVYIGRRREGLHYGNPFTFERGGSKASALAAELEYQDGEPSRTLCGSREEAISRFRSWLDGTGYQDVEPERRAWILEHLPELRGQKLECHCKPAECHGDVYVERLETGTYTEGLRNVITTGLLTSAQAIEKLREYLLDPETIISGANIAFDFGCAASVDPDLLPLIFKAYEESRVHCILVAEALDAISRGELFIDPDTGKPFKGEKGGRGRYSLATCVRLRTGRPDAKANDFFRKRYALLEGVPFEKWPRVAKQYPIDDVENGLEVCLLQLRDAANIDDLPAQCETAWAMHLGAIWGIRTSHERVSALAEKVEVWHQDYLKRFQELGLIRPDGKTNQIAVKRSVALAYGSGKSCETCNGTGWAMQKERIGCRGPKEKGRYKKGCVAGCEVCGSTGFTSKGKLKKCFDCDGTGVELEGVPRAKKGGVAADRDILMESGDEVLLNFAGNETGKIRNTYVPFLRQGLYRPITLSPNVLVESGRTSYLGPIQLLPRTGGVRECFVARDGQVFVSVDYGALELVTLAQVCLWLFKRSRMAEVINETHDPGMLHTSFAAKMIGVSSAELKARIKAGDKKARGYRQAVKPINFGLPGGMGTAKFVLTNRKSNAGSTKTESGREYAGIRFCVLLDDASECGTRKISRWNRRECPPVCARCVELVEEQLKPAWFEQWPEMSDYFDWVKSSLSMFDEDQGKLAAFGPWAEGGVEEFLHNAARTHRVRGGLGYTQASNTSFQSLAADGAKAAFRRVVRECYTDPESPLFGSRPIMFLHDEIFSEVPEEKLHLAGPHKAKIMVEEMRKWTPDVWVVAEPAASKWWYKEMEAVYSSDGRLIPWTPKEK